MELTYDLQSLPKDMSVKEFLNFVRTERIVFWDSSNEHCVAPKIKLDSDLKIKNVSKDLTS